MGTRNSKLLESVLSNRSEACKTVMKAIMKGNDTQGWERAMRQKDQETTERTEELAVKVWRCRRGASDFTFSARHSHSSSCYVGIPRVDCHCARSTVSDPGPGLWFKDCWRDHVILFIIRTDNIIVKRDLSCLNGGRKSQFLWLLICVWNGKFGESSERITRWERARDRDAEIETINLGESGQKV